MSIRKPQVFIASSVEGLRVAEAVNLNLDQSRLCHPVLWPTGTFELGENALESLVKKAASVDFAVFIFTPDDVTTMRDRAVATVRDNVLFELGLFIGALGRERCYIVRPRDIEFHLPSDLLGVNCAQYASERPPSETASALNAACTQIKERIEKLGVRTESVSLTQVFVTPSGVAELSIILGHDGPYVETKNHNIYNMMKTVLIGVRNTGGVYLTNCKLEFEARDNYSDELQTWHRDGPFSLNVGEERYLSLAAYGEPIPPHPTGVQAIQLSAPPSGTFWRAPTLPFSGGVVTLRARSAESQPCEVLCKLWVDNGKLCWDEV